MPRYVVTLTEDERCELKRIIQKGGKGYRIKYAQILSNWTADPKMSADI